MDSKKFLKFWFPVFCYFGIIFFVSSLPGIKIPGPVGITDKLAHLVEYAILGILLSRALRQTTSISPSWVICTVVIVSFVYALSDEFHQSFVPGRDCSIYDAWADLIGSTLGGFLYPLFSQLKSKEE